MGYTPTMRSTLLLAVILLPCAARAQWEIQDSHTTASLRGIHALGNGVAWASGSGGTVLRTTDDGKVWQVCAIPPNGDKLDFRGVQAFDANTAIVMSSGKGDLSRLYKTGDGCKTWVLLFTNPDADGFWDAIKFSSRDLGVLLGDPVNNIFVVMLTFDGGGKWERQTLRATEDVNSEGVFAASNSSLLLPSYPGYRRFCTGGRGGPRLITFEASLTSDVVGKYEPDQFKLHYFRSLYAERFATKAPPFESTGCFSIAENQAFGTTVAVGGDYQKPDDRDDTAWTTAMMSSRATDWQVFHPAQTTPHGYRSAVAYSEKAKAWITVGPNGTDISTDDGRNWRALRPATNPFVGPPEAADADRNWNALSLPFVVGTHGRIGRLRADALAAAKP
jgi:hypothetical protein